MKKILPATLLLTSPSVTFAAVGDVTTLLNNSIIFLNYLIQFLFGIAFLFFCINAIRYFVIGGAKEDEREKARSLATYSVAAFVFLLIFWGVINLLAGSIGLDNCNQPLGDYYLQKNAGPFLGPCS